MASNLLSALSGFHNQQLDSMYSSGANTSEVALALREKRMKAEKIKAFGSDMLDMVSKNPNPTPQDVIGLVSKHGLEMSDATQALGFLKESKALDAARLKATEEADKAAGLKETGPIIPSMDYYSPIKDEAGHIIDSEKHTDYNVASKDQEARRGWLKQEGYAESAFPKWKPEVVETKATRKVDFWDKAGKKVSRLVPNIKYNETIDEYLSGGYSLEDPKAKKEGGEQTWSDKKIEWFDKMLTLGPDMGVHPATAQNIRRAFSFDDDRISEAMQIVMNDPRSAALSKEEMTAAILERAKILRDADRGVSEPANFEQTVKAEYPNAYKGEDDKWYVDKDGETFLIEGE